jgi:hypothetical protein
MNLYKWPALRLAFVPGLMEGIFDAGLGVALFGMPFTLALSMGFILKAVGPGLVVPAMFVLQKKGWGASKGEETRAQTVLVGCLLGMGSLLQAYALGWLLRSRHAFSHVPQLWRVFPSPFGPHSVEGDRPESLTSTSQSCCLLFHGAQAPTPRKPQASHPRW